MNQTDRLLYTCDEGLPSLVTRLIGTNREATHWDFKRIWHKNNADLIHDIICLANNPKGHIGLLIIGVDDGAEHELIDVEEYSENRKDSQKITDLLRACLRLFPTCASFQSGLATSTLMSCLSNPMTMRFRTD